MLHAFVRIKHVPKAQLELKLASTVGNNKKEYIFKYVNKKRRTGENIGPLLDEDVHLTNRDVNKAEMVLYLCLQHLLDKLWDPRCPELGDHDCDKFPENPELL